VVVAWDAGWSGREKTYKDYKAQRSSRPDLLKEQWPHLQPLAEAFGFTNIRVDGYEADDVIATLTREAREKDIPVMVLTGDRDAYQLVGDGVRVMSTGRGVTDTKVYDRDGVIERYGVPPERVTDLIGLKGDTSDNIPGVPGIGDKTAAALLQEYDDLETVLANVENISGAKRKENLTNHADDARISKQLATMIFDVETGLDLSDVMQGEPDRSRLREFAAEFEMRQVIARLEEDWDEAVPERATEQQIEAEPETGAPGDLADGEISLSYLRGRWAGWDGERLIAGEIADPVELANALGERPIVAHDAKALGGGGPRGLVALTGGALKLTHDTMVAAYLIDPAKRTYVLAELAADEGISVAGEAAGGGEAEGQMTLDGEEAGPDPATDARLAAALAEVQRGKIESLELGPLLEKVEMPLIEVLAAMEREGLKLDKDRLEKISDSLAGQAETLQDEIWELAGHEFTIGSPQQLGEVLFNELGLSRKRRGKTGFSTDARVLSQIRD
jgi:DNA polymerase-1